MFPPIGFVRASVAGIHLTVRKDVRRLYHADALHVEFSEEFGWMAEDAGRIAPCRLSQLGIDNRKQERKSPLSGGFQVRIAEVPSREGVVAALHHLHHSRACASVTPC